MPQPTGGLLFMDSPDSEEGATKWIGYSISSIEAGVTPSGTDSYRKHNTNSASNFALQGVVVPTASVSIACLLRLSRYNSSIVSNFIVFFTDGGSTRHLTLHFPSSGSLRVFRNVSTDLGAGSESATGLFSTNTWHHVEMRATIADAGGRAQVWLDGVLVIDFTGDTRNGGTSTDIDMVGFGGGSNGQISEFADLVICDSTTPIGPCRVVPILPSGAGNSTQLSQGAGAGANYERVNEATPDGDTSYVFSDTEGAKDTYAMADLPSGTWDVLAVQANLNVKKSDSGVKFVRPVIRTGSADFNGASVAAAESYGTVREVFDDNPQTTSAWTQTQINAIEVGAEVRDS